MSGRVIYSFIVDEHPKYAFQAWHLAKSLLRHGATNSSDVTIQITPRVSAEIGEIFRAQGYAVHPLEPFGDGKWCNKISQLPNIWDQACERFVLLDTDMIAVGDPRPLLQGDSIQAKVVDGPNPRLDTLLEILAAASGAPAPLMLTDATGDQTVVGNANGGFYGIPSGLARSFQTEWKRWALWLLDHSAPLRRDGKASHVDQVSAMLAFRVSGVPFSPAPSNLNYFVHLKPAPRHHRSQDPICLIHYHDISMNGAGEIAPPIALTPEERTAVETANRQMREDDHPHLRALYLAAR
ncbi:hypothetical protein [Roseixanthobacter glucoisosaccharinicivorans]|uniref:hypothetical protein n=1 Tax=Roseixanthobacter glucoisosaccharinicivorans TaxID=3119923 RepID=UPI00372AA770